MSWSLCKGKIIAAIETFAPLSQSNGAELLHTRVTFHVTHCVTESVYGVLPVTQHVGAA